MGSIVGTLSTNYSKIVEKQRTTLVDWRTRQDSNLWPLPSEPVQNGYARLRNPTLND